MHDGKTFHTGLWLTSIVLLFKLISCCSVCIQQAGDGHFVRDLAHFCHMVSGRPVIHYHGGRFLLSLCQELLVANFLDVMGRPVKREYHTSLPCIWKALISHNHKQDFIYWGNLTVRHFSSLYLQNVEERIWKSWVFHLQWLSCSDRRGNLRDHGHKGSSFKKPKFRILKLPVHLLE